MQPASSAATKSWNFSARKKSIERDKKLHLSANIFIFFFLSQPQNDFHSLPLFAYRVEMVKLSILLLTKKLISLVCALRWPTQRHSLSLALGNKIYTTTRQNLFHFILFSCCESHTNWVREKNRHRIVYTDFYGYFSSSSTPSSILSSVGEIRQCCKLQ